MAAPTSAASPSRISSPSVPAPPVPNLAAPASARMSPDPTPTPAQPAPRPAALARAAQPAATTAPAAHPGGARLAESDASVHPRPESTPAGLVRVASGRPVAVAGRDGPSGQADYAEGNPPLAYPRAAVRLGLQGTVILEVEVLADGRAGQIRLHASSGHALLDLDARHQVARWRFKPPQRLGRAHDTWVRVPVHYTLDRK